MKQKRLLFLLALLMTAATGAWAQTGMTNGSFSVSATKRVHFSKGNLQLVGENTFQFAENQWDYFGINQSDNHRDLFCWGTGNDPNQTTGNSTFTDWGDNTYLQATLGKGWRTLTKDEFTYVFNTRASGSSVFDNADGRYTTATINTGGTGVKGIILFPDGITIAADEVTTPGTINGTGTVTQCTTAQWAALAEKGCVFLPAGGFFLSGGAYGYGDITDYWSSTAADASKAYNLGLNFAVPGAVVNTAGTLGYNYGCAVRLVIDQYYLTLADGTEDAAKWTATVGTSNTANPLPVGGLNEKDAVTLTYGGHLKVKNVTATTDAKPDAWDGDLSKLTAESTAEFATATDGMTITGRLAANVKVSIAAGATVTLDGVTIVGDDDENYKWAGLNCLGDATIILKDRTQNRVQGFHEDYPGIHVPAGSRLTITGGTLGNGMLTATSSGYGAGIGGGNNIHCGNIDIQGGYIAATGGIYGAGIGGGLDAICGNITISGGTVRAMGGPEAAGIGGGSGGSCGAITITNGVTRVFAMKDDHSPYSIGAGNGGSCVTVAIGGMVYWQDNAAVNDGDDYLATNPLEYRPMPQP